MSFEVPCAVRSDAPAQVVLTIPKRLRAFFRYDRCLLGDLAACACRTLRLYFQVYYGSGSPSTSERRRSRGCE